MEQQRRRDKMYPQDETHPASATGTALRILAVFEQPLKWLTFALGLGSTLCVVQGWQLAAMTSSLPFCLIWIYFGWLRSERQLQYINVVFAIFYIYGIARHFFLNL